MLSKIMRFFLYLLLFYNGLVFSLSYERVKEDYHKSFVYEKLGDYKNAIRVLMEVYKAYPNGYTVNLRLGWLYYLMGKYENSIYHYKKALKTIPSSLEAKLGLTLPLMAQKKWDEAEQVLYKILATDYYNYYGNLRLCTVLEAQKKYSQQKMVALKMLSVYPTSVPFLVCLAKSYYHLGEKEKAKNLFKDILILDPENLTAKEFLKKLQKTEKGEN